VPDPAAVGLAMAREVEDRKPMARASSLSARFAAFVAERFPFALALARDTFASLGVEEPGRDAEAIEKLRQPLLEALNRALDGQALEEIAETTPGVGAAERLRQARGERLEAWGGFFEREAIAAGLTREERVEILRGMVLTRATDNRLKAFFSGGEVRWKGTAFQGKGFRSLGQEAIYAAAIRLKRGPAFRGADGTWKGDVVAPLIRDLGGGVAMRPEGETVRMVLNAQRGKAGPPMGGKDLHVGDFSWGILPATAPLAVSSLTVAGMAMAFAREGSE